MKSATLHLYATNKNLKIKDINDISCMKTKNNHRSPFQMRPPTAHVTKTIPAGNSLLFYTCLEYSFLVVW